MTKKLLTMALTAALATAAAPAMAAADPAEAFLQSKAAERLRNMMMEVLFVAPLEGQDLLVAYYVPDQGGISQVDDETRFNLYRPEGGDFKAVQFLGKPGELFPGKLDAWRVEDLDGDGFKEIIAVSRPLGFNHKVRSLVFRRAGAEAKFKDVFKRYEVGAALLAEGPELTYTFIDRAANRVRRFEHYRLEGGQYQPRQAD